MPRFFAGDAVCLCGSIADGSDKDAIISLLVELKEAGALLVIDSKSLSTEEILFLKPYLIKPNEEEAELLSGMRPLSLEDAARIAAALRDGGCENVMLTMGKSGAALASSDGVYIAGVPSISAVSTVGAGDSSIAGFLAAVADGMNSAGALALAVAYGSAACMEEGRMPPSPKNVSSVLQKVTISRVDV